MLRLATELTTPIPERRASLSGMKSERAAKTNRRKSAAPQLLAGGTADVGRIDRRPNDPAHERADGEFRRGVNLVNQGRVAEGMDRIRAALQIPATKPRGKRWWPSCWNQNAWTKRQSCCAKAWH
jgi:hypothetical protein